MNQRLTELVRLFRTFMIIMVITFSTTVVIGLVLASFNPDFKQTSGKAVKMPAGFFSNLLSFEMPHYQAEAHIGNTNKTVNFLLSYLLDVDFNDPKALMGGILPGMNTNRSTLLYPGNDTEGAIDYPSDDEHHVPETGESENNHSANPAPAPSPDNEPSEEEENTIEPPVKTVSAPEIFVYHSHNRESWLPELPSVKKESLAFDKKTNVTLLGERLTKKLNEAGIKSLHDASDYPSIYGDLYNGLDSYLYSRKKVKEVLATNKELHYFFDIHRDSGPRKATTAEINGVQYAQLYIIIGAENPNWESNYAFAKKFIKILNDKYPGLSKGIFAKDHSQGNGVYNQDLALNSMIIEVGGVNNTLEESYRTIDALTSVIARLYKNDKA
ncbi:stage II sporulation protein P [Paenibacillus sp. LHD-38]|uniref:stage II sporulation protein P n=1 Tax=Paenibacillus sp. LHD-38 TaxID=3072143 RepID=UPI00280FFF92|nr:stage II sporulation protein P [Paenibacillus sp. LHD-38]MDQ8736116.1 stage II sporulation protein P [Paenibacillus sp. LHD-38]